MESQTLAGLLRRHPSFDGLTERHLELLRQQAVEVQFGPDEIVFREGDECRLFYLIMSGTVALETVARGRVFSISTLAPGDELGWSSLLEGGGKTFQARPLEQVRALAFDGARLQHLCEEDPEFGYVLARRLLDGLARRLRATRLQLLETRVARAAS